MPLRVGAAGLCWLTSLWVLAFSNEVFWRRLWAASEQQSVRGLLAAGMLAATLAVLLAFALRLLCWRGMVKPVLVSVLLLSAGIAHFVGTYGAMIDKGMLRNVLETDWREASELLTGTLLWEMLWRGVLPSALVIAVEVRRVSWQEATKELAIQTVGVASVCALSLAAFFAEYAAAARNQRELRHLLTPSNIVNAGWGLWKQRSSRSVDLVKIAGDASRRPTSGTRPRLVVLVVGETARAASFSMAGYGRETNAALKQAEGVYLGSALACGTDTATSLPCMFSDLGVNNFTVEAALGQENVLDVLQRVGVKVAWIENNSGCKGVCSRVPTQRLSGSSCVKNQCLDEELVPTLAAQVSGTQGDRLVVLHMLGSHGPAYYLRHPSRCRHFEPTCDTADLQRCSVEALRNSYDNTIAYTSEVLADLIGKLREASDRVDSVLLYVSDHGESLGEGNVYLHGLPKAIAPDEQKRVPIVAWASAGASAQLRPLAEVARAVGNGATHDNLFHTLLGLFQVQTVVYRADLDLLSLPEPAPRRNGSGR